MRQNSSGVLSTETLCRLIRQIVVKHISRTLLGFFKSPELLQFHTVPRLINYQQIIFKLEIIQTFLLVNKHALFKLLFFILVLIFSYIHTRTFLNIYVFVSHLFLLYHFHCSPIINIVQAQINNIRVNAHLHIKQSLTCYRTISTCTSGAFRAQNGVATLPLTNPLYCASINSFKCIKQLK